MRDRIVSTMRQLQSSICEGIEGIETVRFGNDVWEREDGGGGVTRVLENGTVIEKGGVNFSEAKSRT